MRLKIPWGQPREGSSPFPSISYYQFFRLITHCAIARLTELRTQKLRTQPKQSRTEPNLPQSSNSKSFSTSLFFSCDRYDKCGVREKILSHLRNLANVASVADLCHFNPTTPNSTKFYLQLRKNCVIETILPAKSLSCIAISYLIQGICYPLYLQNSNFHFPISYEMRSHGNDT